MRPSPTCRICGHSAAAEHELAPAGAEGDVQRRHAQVKMDRGFCSRAACVLEALRREQEQAPRRRHLRLISQ